MAAVFATAVMAVAGCGSGRSNLTATEMTPASVCVAKRLAVSAGLDGVQVTNTSAAACTFSGRYPVEMDVWQLDGPAPPPATGQLAAGATYVQPYTAGASNGCPAASLPDGGSLAVTVHVEGAAVQVSLLGQRAHEIEDCVSFTAGWPRIKP